MTASLLRGRCACGAVAFSLTCPTDFVAHCHCESCRRTHASAFVTWTSVPLERFAFTRGEDHVTWYRSSQWIGWGFCKHCGSSMFYRAEREGHPEAPRLDRMYVAVGALIDPPDRPAQVHVSYEERAPWFTPGDALPKHRGKTDERVDD